MGEKCKPSYKNLNTIQSYSEQKYATVQWCEQNCENDEWLRQQVEELRYLTPPAVRKRYDISSYLDEKHSYSCRGTSDHQVIFDNSPTKVVTFDFKDIPNQVETKSTDAHAVSYNAKPETDETGFVLDDDSGEYKFVDTPKNERMRYELPNTIETFTIPAQYSDFGTMLRSDGAREHINSYWYVAWDKDKNYYVRPDWLKNWKDGEIKSVCRAQTFKAEAGGSLTSIDLALDWNGSKISNCGSPLYVQIWNTYPSWVYQSSWDDELKKMKYKYIKYADIPNDEKSAYEGKQRYGNPKTVNVKYTYGKNKGKVKKKTVIKNGKKTKVNVTEKKYPKQNNGPYVRKLKKVYKPGEIVAGSKYTHQKYNPLAEAVYKKVGEPFPNIKFETPCTLVKGKYYAIVLFSPLSEWKHCPRWGGWGRNCRDDKMYNSGYAFLSKNNGLTWSIYGKDGVETITTSSGNEKAVDYKQGKYTPQDFAFECHVETTPAKSWTEITYSTEKHYLTLKPIYSNPIQSVELNSECYGTENIDDGYFIDFEVSTDGESWTEIRNGGTLVFNGSDITDYPRVLLVRAVLYRDPSDNYKSGTPYINEVKVRLNTLPSYEMYARTLFYKPVTAPMLGASLWGRVFAPFKCEETVECTAEIIQGSEVSRHIKIIEVDSLDETLQMVLTDDDPSNNKLFDEFHQKGININNIISKTGEERAILLTETPSLLDILKKYDIYVKPFHSADNLKLYLLSFGTESKMITTRPSMTTPIDGSDEEEEVLFEDYEIAPITFNDNVAYPILSFEGIPQSSDKGSTGDSFSEIIDYTFDYDTDQLFLKRRVLESLVEQTFEIKYNKVFMKGLTSEELGEHIDEETGLHDDGLILDYFKETVIIDDDNITSRRVKLRAEPTDPIRRVYLYKYDAEEGDEPKELGEDYDFTLDIDTNELVFNVNNEDGVSTVLDVNDKLVVVYTPFLTDDSLAIGYYATRTNTDKQCYIENMYYEYKV